MLSKIIRLAPLSVAVWLVTLTAWVLSPLIAGISIARGKNEVGGLLAYLCTHDAGLESE